MPVIAVVDKSYSGSDFYFMSDSTVRFTITKPRVITAITTSTIKQSRVSLPCRLKATDLFHCASFRIFLITSYPRRSFVRKEFSGSRKVNAVMCST